MTVPKRFRVLRFFGTLMKVIAWIILIIGHLQGQLTRRSLVAPCSLTWLLISARKLN